MGLRNWKYVSADTFMVCPVFITYFGSSIPPVRQWQKQSLGSDADSGSPAASASESRLVSKSLFYLSNSESVLSSSSPRNPVATTFPCGSKRMVAGMLLMP